MIQAFSKDNEQSQQISPAPRDIALPSDAISFEDFIHDLRQPLGVIDSLSFFLELTSTDLTNTGPHLRRIRAMVHQVHRLLETALLVQSGRSIDPGQNTEVDE